MSQFLEIRKRLRNIWKILIEKCEEYRNQLLGKEMSTEKESKYSVSDCLQPVTNVIDIKPKLIRILLLNN